MGHIAHSLADPRGFKDSGDPCAVGELYVRTNFWDEGTNLQTWKSFLAAIAGAATPDEHGDSDLQLQLLNTLTAQFPDSVDAASYDYLKEVTWRFYKRCSKVYYRLFRVEGFCYH